MEKLKKPTVRELAIRLTDLVMWERFAIHLPEIETPQIEIIKRESPQAIEDQKIQLFNKWLRTCPSASWEHVIHALETVGENAIASDIRRKCNILAPLSSEKPKDQLVAPLKQCVVDVLTSHFATLRRSITELTLSDLAAHLLSSGIIAAHVNNNPSYHKISKSFAAGLNFVDSREKISDYCRKYFAAFYACGGPLRLAADKVKRDITEKVKEKLGIDFIIQNHEIHVEPPYDTPADEPLPYPNKRPPNPEMDEPDGSSIEEGSPQFQCDLRSRLQLPEQCMSSPENPFYGREYRSGITENKIPQPSVPPLEARCKEFCKEVVIILHTVNDNEKLAVLDHLKPPALKGKPVDRPVDLYEPNNIVLGMFGGYPSALIQTGMGKDCREEIETALGELPNANYVLAIGIAFAFHREKCKYGDVLVSTYIDGIGNVKFRNDGKRIFRAGGNRLTQISQTLTNVFTKVVSTWDNKFPCTENSGRYSKVHPGVIISTEILIDHKPTRDAFLEYIPDAIGGEMEGATLVQIQRWYDRKPNPRQLEIIIIKGVADYADGSKEKSWQLTSAMAAANYAEHKLIATGRTLVSAEVFTQHQNQVDVGSLTADTTTPLSHSATNEASTRKRERSPSLIDETTTDTATNEASRLPKRPTLTSLPDKTTTDTGCSSKPASTLLMKSPKPNDAHRLIKSHSSQWNELGIELDVSHNDLEEIKTDGNSNSERLNKVVNKWIDTGSVPVTWAKLIQGLEQIGLNIVAKSIKEFLKTEKALATYGSLPDWTI